MNLQDFLLALQEQLDAGETMETAVNGMAVSGDVPLVVGKITHGATGETIFVQEEADEAVDEAI